MIKFWQRLDYDFKAIILPIAVVILTVVTFGTAYGAAMLNLKHNNVNPNFSIIKTYKNNAEIITNNYNETLDDAKKNNKLIDISDFLDRASQDTTWNESSETTNNLNRILVVYVNSLVDRLKKVNVAIKNNIKIDYDSLKLTYNSNKDNKLAIIINDYVNNYRTQYSLQVASFATLLLALAMTALLLILMDLDKI